MRRRLAALSKRATRGFHPERHMVNGGAPSYLSDPYYNPVVAFNGAMGYGANTTGGRGNGTNGDTTLYFVDNLNDSGTGSLRAAMETTGKRVIVPRVGGTIELASRITLYDSTNQGDVTFLGQLAPGGGLAARHSALPATHELFYVRASNVIMRHMRWRSGEGTNLGAGMTVWAETAADLTDVILDHCSASWATDELVTIYGGTTTGVKRITMQNCLVAEALTYDTHPYGPILGQQVTQQTSLLYNLMMSGTLRFPYYRNVGDNQMVGNVIYNSEENSRLWVVDLTDGVHNAVIPTLDCINNTWSAGPLTNTAYAMLVHSYLSPQDWRASLYMRGNKSWQITDESDLDDQWSTVSTLQAWDGAVSEWRSNVSNGSPAVLERDRLDAVDFVLANAGASLPRDSLDTRFVSEATNNTGPSVLPNTVSAAGGYPSVAAGTYPTASDGAISDAWRTANSETREWYELDTGGTGRMILENYADDVADGVWVET